MLFRFQQQTNLECNLQVESSKNMFYNYIKRLFNRVAEILKNKGDTYFKVLDYLFI